MKFGFKFSNLCGVVYKQGNLLFTSDGNTLLSPVGNHITIFDLVNHSSTTLPFENRKNIYRLALSPNDQLLLSIDEEGYALLINLQKRIVLSHFNFKEMVRSVKFSPDGKYVCVSHRKGVQIWHTPSTEKQFAPFVLHRTYSGHYDVVNHIDWSPDSKFFLTTSRDCNIKLWSLSSSDVIAHTTLSGHRDVVASAFFSSSRKSIASVGKDGCVCTWKQLEDVVIFEDPENHHRLQKQKRRKLKKWTLTLRHYFDMGRVVSCQFNIKASLLVVGFNTGSFGLYEISFEDQGSVTPLQTMSVGKRKLSSCAISPSSHWLAFGSASAGQLLVWEWESETYVLKQTGHELGGTNALAYSSDGAQIASGGDDGKIRVWGASSGLCFVTFTDHTAPISALLFSSASKVLFSASLDGTARAYDMIRYRNFRTFQVPSTMQTPQFSSLAIDPSGEILCVGSMSGSFDIYIFSVQTSRLLDVLSGHEAPVSSLSFSPASGLLASGSWDKTCRLWDVFNSKSTKETLSHSSEVLSVAFRPDGKEICTASLDGVLHFWDPLEGTLKITLEGRKDVMGGRKVNDVRTAKTSASTKHFTCVCYSADGKCILAAGNSKYVVIYEIAQKIMLKKFQISHNRSLDGVLDFLNSKSITESGLPIELIDFDKNEEEGLAKPYIASGSLTRSTNPAIRVKGIQFSPTGRAWAAASTEGLLIYSLDETSIFDPFDLDIDITPENIKSTLGYGLYLKALIMSFRLNEKELIKKVYESIPASDVQLISSELSFVYVPKLLAFVGNEMEKSPHIEFHLLWLLHLFNAHGNALRSNFALMSTFRNLQKTLSIHHSDLQRVCAENVYTLEYLTTLPVRDQRDGSDTKKQKESVTIDTLEEELEVEDDGISLPGWGSDDFIQPTQA